MHRFNCHWNGVTVFQETGTWDNQSVCVFANNRRQTVYFCMASSVVSTIHGMLSLKCRRAVVCMAHGRITMAKRLSSHHKQNSWIKWKLHRKKTRLNTTENTMTKQWQNHHRIQSQTRDANVSRKWSNYVSIYSKSHVQLYVKANTDMGSIRLAIADTHTLTKAKAIVCVWCARVCSSANWRRHTVDNVVRS